MKGRTVVAKLMGGLGNQMLQYATGLVLAEKLNAQYLLDTEYYKIDSKLKNTHREFELGIFNIRHQRYRSLLSNYIVNKFVLKVPGLRKKILPLFSTYYLTDADRLADALHVNGLIYLDGYWTSFLFFDEYRDLLRKVFAFSPFPDEVNKNFSMKMSRERSVAIHIRRTDYLLPGSSHCVLEKGYYQRAIEYIRHHVTDARLYFFGDDHEWIRANFPIDNHCSFLIDHNKGKQSYMDMALMAHCRHIVISNSTFSWWSAYLNPYEDKIVVAPVAWFKEGEAPYFDYDKFIPGEWVRIKA